MRSILLDYLPRGVARRAPELQNAHCLPTCSPGLRLQGARSPHVTPLARAAFLYDCDCNCNWVHTSARLGPTQGIAVCVPVSKLCSALLHAHKSYLITTSVQLEIKNAVHRPVSEHRA